MSKDANAAKKQRLAEALQANLRRRKAAKNARAVPENAAETKDDARETRAEGAS